MTKQETPEEAFNPEKALHSDCECSNFAKDSFQLYPSPTPDNVGDTGRSNVTIIPGMLPVMGHSSRSVARDEHLHLQIKR